MKILKANKTNIDIASNLILQGGIVAFPTETVYGLGALASNKAAVNRVFTIKGRPRNNPLIVHVHNIEQVLSIVNLKKENIKAIMENLWPGPLTLVMKYKLSNQVHKIARANLNTVAVRIPSNPVALNFLRRINSPIVAPSANTSEHLSPTTAKHVKYDLEQKLNLKSDMILDGGNCKIGIESTVIDVTKDKPIILRPGGLSIEKIKKYFKNIQINHIENTNKPLSPGQFKKHYSPKANLKLNAKKPMGNDAWLGFGKDSKPLNCKFKMNLSKKGDLNEAATNLYSMLRYLDNKKVTTIAVKSIPNQGIGIAINDRLIRGSSK